MKISNWLSNLKERNPILFRVGLFHLILAVLLIVPLAIDTRLVSGINPWIKPIKFSISVGIYCWTIGWLLFDLKSQRWVPTLSLTIGGSMIIEIGILLYQASRGVRSHFNIDTPLDGILFGLMGILILINTVCIIIIFIRFLKSQPRLEPLYLWGIRAGLFIFLLGSIVGSQMIGHNAHSVGVADGGPGIPFFNWSTVGGDLRIAHFMGLHALQLMPLCAIVLIQKISQSESLKRIIFLIIVLCYVGIMSFLWRQALQGTPLIG